MESYKNKTNRTLCTILLVYLFVYKCKPSHGFKQGLNLISAQVQENSITRKHCPSGNGFPSCWTQSACSYPSTNLNVILVVKPRKNTLPGNLPPSLPETNPPECYTSGQTKEEYPVWKSSTSLSETSPQFLQWLICQCF